MHNIFQLSERACKQTVVSLLWGPKKYLQNYAPCCFDKGPIHEREIQTLKNVPHSKTCRLFSDSANQSLKTLRPFPDIKSFLLCTSRSMKKRGRSFQSMIFIMPVSFDLPANFHFVLQKRLSTKRDAKFLRFVSPLRNIKQIQKFN